MSDKELYEHYTLEEIEWFADHGIRAIVRDGYIVGWEVDV